MAQVNAGPDTVSCGGPVTLTASVFQRPSTTAYTVSEIAYSPLSFTSGTNVPLTDDGYTSALPIGFPFCFFGQSFTQFYISANGWISFSPANQFAQVNNNPSAFPSSSNNVPRNAVAIWEDWNPPQGGTVNYYTTGTIPNRKLVVNYNNVPHYQCTSELLKAQIILYEGTNVIEYHVASKGSCPTWQSGKATQGVHNAAGTVAFTVPGRNASVFSLTDDAYRFSPSGPPEPASVKWFDLSTGGPPVGTGMTFTVNPANTNSYSVEVTYGCSPGLFRDTVSVSLDKTILSVSKTDVSCFGGTDGSAVVTVSGSNPPYTYSWSSDPVDTNSSLTGVPMGTYYVQVIHNGCVFSDSAVIQEPPAVVINTGSIPETCGDNNGIAYATAVGGEGPYTYTWNTGIVNDSLLNVPSGTYTVTVADNNGCTISSIAEVSQTSGVNAAFVPSVVTGTAPLQVVFTNTSTGADAYIWKFGEGTLSTSINPSFTYDEPGIYDVVLTATYASVCKDEYTVTIVVIKDSIPELEPVFIPNVLVLNSSNEQNRIFKVRGSDLEEVTITIFNRWGKEVYQTAELTDGWNGGNEPSGTYYYIVTYKVKGQEPVLVKSFVTLFR